MEHNLLQKVGLKMKPNSFADITSLGGSSFEDQATKTLMLKTLGAEGGPLEVCIAAPGGGLQCIAF